MNTGLKRFLVAFLEAIAFFALVGFVALVIVGLFSYLGPFGGAVTLIVIGAVIFGLAEALGPVKRSKNVGGE